MGNEKSAGTAIAAGKVAAGYAVTQEGAGWAELEVGIINITGRDHSNWLHKIITSDVEHLGEGKGERAALLDAKGHITADFVALRLADSILLMVEAAATKSLLDGLRRYVIREKVDLYDDSGKWVLFTLVGIASDDVAARLFGHPAPAGRYSFVRCKPGASEIILARSGRALVPATDILAPSGARYLLRGELAGIPQVSIRALEIMRVEAGVPRWGVDFSANNLVLEIPEVFSVRVDQGCYVGQEVVARLVHRGHVNRLLTGFKFEGGELPTPGTLIFLEGKEVGSVTSSAISPRFGSIGLGYVRREFSGHATWLNLESQARAQVVKLPFED